MKEYCVKVTYDDEAAVWVAENDDIPLAMESGSLDLLIERVRQATPEILDLNGKLDDRIHALHFMIERYLEAS